MNNADDLRRRLPAIAEHATWWMICVAIWLATLTSFSGQELVAAGVCAIPCAVAARAARRAVRGSWRPPPDSLRAAALLIPAIVADAVGALRLAARGRPTGRFAALPLPREPTESRRAGRAAVTTVLTSATPGAVVVGADRELLVVHAFPLPATRMSRRLRRSRAHQDR
ncbi:Na+/H+ antiporter subunit E [Nocardia terpenica]|uniref:Na+/H+ antiporter subunit E n=1 Tax=Nocardia terpenica TaxID=455432 RepID=UPI0018931B95|nr:Na+/H+ antiporter subunit E [Nocardia terpenica]MBF6060040.1 Na+/H+ antiporter subunit E [Nocardia terpenica]MBF6102419.1 Na+/H+ antiporter subunit E [Nocardia terpenica]MBF6111390.1 Na+/H+ antiporter subunit E [Nocardia terpenica]MBF6117521.1 Na+/H+ antiporter subunit E [Nocardia terpenica]MBF6150638.1 Na+/H+ antiporter subunit E [Nocardia terpenica]